MPSRSLPARPNLQSYRKQAKDLLKRCEAGDVAALARFREHHPHPRKSGAARQTAFRLSGAQHVLAREHGFDSWPKFVKHLEAAGGGRPVPPAAPRVIQLQVPTHNEINLGVFLPDTVRMLTATEAEPVRLWDFARGTCLRQFGEYSAHAWALKAAANRSALIGCRDGAVRLVDLDSGGVAKTLIGHRGFVRCLDTDADLTIAVSGGMQDLTLRLWDLPSEQCVAVLEGHRGGIYCAALDREGRRALSGSRDGTIRLWNLENRHCEAVIDAHAYHVHAVAWAADGRRALSCSQEIRLWDLEHGICLRTFEGHTETIRSVTWNPDQRLALSAAHDRTVRVWDVATGACLRVFAGHSAGAINAAWLSADRIASCDWNGEVRTWSMAG
jgi:WD40 repeat protein